MRSADADAQVLAALARAIATKPLPLILVDLDPAIDDAANARLVSDAIGGRRVSLVVALGSLRGDALTFKTANGDLVPAFDRYADAAGVPHVPTLVTVRNVTFAGSDAFLGTRVVYIGGDARSDGDLRPDAAALLGYLAGRIALGAEEVPR